MTPCANMLRRQAASGTAIWLRGASHRFLSSKRAMHRSVLHHMRLISELRLYKIEQCRNLLEARPLWENLGSVQFYTDPFPPCAQAATDSSRYRKATGPRFSSLPSQSVEKGAF